MGFFSKVRDIAKGLVVSKRQKEATERFKRGLARGADRGAGSTPSASSRVVIPGEIEEEEDIYEIEESRSFIPGPDPSSLRSGDLLTTAVFYGITDDEYETLENLINTAYADPAASEDERREAINEIQDAMSSLHTRARESMDFDWAAWREEHYPKGATTG